MKDIKSTCDPCEENFKNKTNDLVKEGTAPSQAEHWKREQEVKSAYGSNMPNQPAGQRTPSQYDQKSKTDTKSQIGDKAQKIGDKVKEYGEKAKEYGGQATAKVGEKVQQFGEKTQQFGEKMADKASRAGSEIKNGVKTGVDEIKR